MKPGIGKYFWMAIHGLIWPFIALIGITDHNFDKLQNERRDAFGLYGMMTLLLLWIPVVVVAGISYTDASWGHLAAALLIHWAMGIICVMITLRKKFRRMVKYVYPGVPVGKIG